MLKNSMWRHKPAYRPANVSNEILTSRPSHRAQWPPWVGKRHHMAHSGGGHFPDRVHRHLFRLILSSNSMEALKGSSHSSTKAKTGP